MKISELVEKSHANARIKGFWDDTNHNIPEKLMLIVSEASEALEAYRDGCMDERIQQDTGKPEGFPVEIADMVIRIADLCGKLGIDLESVIARKMAYNATRPYRHHKAC